MQVYLPRWNIMKDIQFDSYLLKLYQMQLVSTATILMKYVLLYFCISCCLPRLVEITGKLETKLDCFPILIHCNSFEVSVRA